MNLLFDTHAHINLEHFNDDREELIEKMFSEGLGKIVIPGIEYDTIYSALELAKKYPGKIYSAVGFHPTDVNKWEPDTYEKLRSLAMENKEQIVAVGETGLDYYWDRTTPELQKEILILHIKLAKELKLPLIIHTRDSLEDTWDILNDNGAQEFGGIFHCFSGDLDYALKCIDLNFYISFAGNITFKTAENLRQVAQNIPMERILIETDSPFLTPVPFRGKRNDPSKVYYVAKQIAELRNMDIDEVIKQTRENGERVFGLSNS